MKKKTKKETHNHTNHMKRKKQGTMENKRKMEDGIMKKEEGRRKKAEGRWKNE